MKLLYICNEYPPATHGGIGIVVKTLAEQLVQRGHTAIVVGYDPNVERTVWESVNLLATY